MVKSKKELHQSDWRDFSLWLFPFDVLIMESFWISIFCFWLVCTAHCVRNIKWNDLTLSYDWGRANHIWHGDTGGGGKQERSQHLKTTKVDLLVWVESLVNEKRMTPHHGKRWESSWKGHKWAQILKLVRPLNLIFLKISPMSLQ